MKLPLLARTRSLRPPVLLTGVVSHLSLALVIAFVMSLLSSSAFAANDTWTGKGGANWSTSANWLGGVAPVANDSLFFDGAVGLNPNNDFAANTVFSSITFNTGAAPFVLSGNVLNLAGNITNNNSLNAQTIGLPLALTGSRTVNVALRPGALALTSAVSETGGTGFGLTKTGNGLLTLSASNAFTGPVTVNGGTLAVPADTGLGLASGAVTAGSIVLDGGALRATANGSINSNRSITLGGGGGTIDVSVTVTNNGAISGGNSFTKTGSGQLTLGGTNSYTGSTFVNHGTLRMDFTQPGAPTANIINSDSPLVMSAVSTMYGTVNTAGLPTFNVTGSGAAARSQTVNGLILNKGSATVSTTTNNQNVLLALGGITRNTAGMVNFIPAGTLVSGVNAITTTTANDANGILGGWAAFNSTNYAANDGSGNIVAHAGYTNFPLNVVITNGVNVLATSNVRLNSGTGPATLADAGVTAINTLLQNFTTAETINIAAGQTLAFGANGGVMIGTGKANVTLGNVAGQGTITAGSGDGVTPGEINILNFNNTTVTFNSVIADNGTGPVKLSIGTLATSANNTVALNNNTGNTYSGGTVISSGRVQVNNSANNFGTGPVTILNNGQVFLSFAGTYPNDFNISGAAGAGGSPVGDTPSAIRLAANNSILTGTITLLSDAAIGPRNTTGQQLQGQITGNYNFTMGDGSGGGQVVLFNTANNWTGNFLINAERVFVGASEVIPNGAGFGDVILTANGGSILDLNGVNETINGLSSLGTQPFVQNGGTLTLGDGDATATFSGTVRDNGGSLSITKIGSGVQTFSGANTYTGTTTISNGTLVVSTAQSAASGAITVIDGATLGVTASGASQLSPSAMTVGSSTGATIRFDLNNPTVAPINPSSVTINGTATININSALGAINSYPLINNYTGGGTLALGSQPPHILGNLSVVGNTIYYNVTNFTFDTWTAGNGNWDTTSANWTNSLPSNLYSQGDFVQFDDTPVGAGPFAVSNAVIVQPSGIYVTNNTKNYSISGLAIAGIGGLIKDGSSSLTLSNVNTFTGPTTISAGQLTIGGAGQLGGGTYSAAITDNGALTYNSSANQTLSGAISGTGTVTNNGSGALILSSGASAFSGVTLNAGTLTVGANSTPNTVGSTVTSGPVGTGTLTLSGGTLNNNAGITIANNVNVVAATTTAIQAVNGNNWTINGNITGSGNFNQTANGSTAQVGLGGDNSGFTGTWTENQTGNGNVSLRFDSASAGSANAAWVFNVSQSQRCRFNFGTGTINFGSMSGSVGGTGLANTSAGAVVATLSVGALNTSTTFAGVMEANGANGIIALTKVGTGALTLSGANAYTGLTTIENGSLVASNNAPSGAVGAFGNSSGAIALGDDTSLGSSFNPSLLIGGPFTIGRTVTVGSNVGANSSVYILGGSTDNNSIFSGNISLNESLIVTQAVNTAANALTISGVIGTLNGATPVVTFVGPGKTILSAANTYTGNTFINGGRLALTGSGNIGLSANIKVASGAIYDVSGVTYTLGGSQTLSGSGTVTGAVTTASSGSSISPAPNGVAGTLTFNNNLNLSSGASEYLDLSISHLGGNDQIAVGGNLTLGSSDTVHINALSGAANLDQTADYVLFSVAGTTTMSAQPGLLFDGTAPANFANYSVQKSGNNIVLHYSASPNPVVSFITVTNNLDGSTTAARYQTVTVFATVSAGAGTITNVSANLSSIGGSAAQVMNNLGGGNYSYTTTVGTGALVGNDVVTVTATDTTPGSGSSSAILLVSATTVTWDGLATDNNWGSGTNWVGNNPPGFSGDSLIFAGSTQTTANMNNNYAVAGLTFDSTAGNFTITNPPGTALTLNGTLENDSSSPQALSMPIVLGTSETINDPNSAGITLGGAVSGAGGLTVGSGIVTLSGSNSYAGDTTVSATLKVGNSAAIPNGSGKGNVILAGTLDLNGTNATVNGLGGSGTVDNTSATDASTLTVGNNNNTISLSGVVVQNSVGANLALVKVGTGDLALPSPNTYAGGTTVSNGTVTIGNNAGAGTGVITLAGGTLKNNAILNIANTILAQAGTTSLIDNATANNFTFSGGFTGSGTITRGSSQVNSVFLTGDNSGFTGTFQDQNSAASVTRFTSATAGSASARWIFNQAALVGRTSLDFTDGTISFGSMTGAGFLGGNNSVGTKTVEVGALGLNETFSGSIQNVFGVLAVNKVGTGTWTLRGANAYTGLTTVSNGTLVISTAHVGNGDLTVNDNKALGVINNGGTQTALLNNLTLGDSAGPTTLFFTNVASITTPVITAAAAVTLNGTCNIAISNSVVNSGSVYPLVKYGSLGGVGSFVLSSVPSGVTATLTNDTSNLWIALKVSVGNGVNTNPTNITTVVSGSTLTLSWPADHLGWHLQAQTNSLAVGISTNWVTIPNSDLSNSYTNTIDTTKGTVFYRLVYP